MARVVAVCSSEKKGTIKKPVEVGILKVGYGLEGDAHADYRTHRQVSLLAIESIKRMRQRGFDLGAGSFAENLTIEGLDLPSLPIGTTVRVGTEIVLEISQIGKECHSGCAVRKLTGDCIMPREGVFARVVHGGAVREGDPVRVEPSSPSFMPGERHREA